MRYPALFLTAVLAAGLPAAAQTRTGVKKIESSRIKEVTATAPSTKTGLQVQETEIRYKEALKKAAGPQQRAEISLDHARILAAEPGLRAEVDRLYTSAIQQATGRLKVDASNSYGVFLLQQGDAAKAASVLSAVEGDLKVISGELEPEARSRFLYNYGVALEKSGQAKEASAAYLQSFELDPGFMPACDAVFRTAGSDSRIRVVERLLAEGNLDSARSYLQTSFESGTPESYPDLVVLWVRYLTAAKIGPGEDFRNTLKLPPGWKDGPAGALVGMVEKSYAGELPLVLDPDEGSLYASFWRDDKEVLSNLLRMLGEGFLRAGRYQQALHSYALAWSSARNMDAAVDLASLLLTQREKVDPQGQVIDRLVSVLFQGKGEAYLGGDWPNILRFHTVLGTIFERQGRWGSSDDPRSAIFQWERALRALQQVRTGEPNLAPGLHAHLGTAYKAAGRQQEALAQFLLAGEQYVKAGWPETAMAPLRQAETLASSAGPQERKRLDDLVLQTGGRLKSMEANEPPK